MGLLHLSHNDLSGSIPAELGSLANLFHLTLHENELAGLVPLEVAQVGAAITGTCRLDSNAGLYMPATAEYEALGDPICGIPLSPLSVVAEIVEEEIEDYVASEELSAGIATALVRQFAGALARLDEGNVVAADRGSDAIIRELTALVESGQVSADVGEDLMALAAAFMS